MLKKQLLFADNEKPRRMIKSKNGKTFWSNNGCTHPLKSGTSFFSINLFYRAKDQMHEFKAMFVVVVVPSSNKKSFNHFTMSKCSQKMIVASSEKD